MLEYSAPPIKHLKHNGHRIASFVSDSDRNVDRSTVDSFGEEWKKFKAFDDTDIENVGQAYFDIISDDMLEGAVVLDLGCGSGRWSRYLALKVAFIEAIDPSEAVYAAADLNRDIRNIRVTQAGVDRIPFGDGSFDFIVCLGVLHHVPDTEAALATAVRKLKHGGHFLLYLYYNLENRGPLSKALFFLVNATRAGTSRLPKTIKHVVCDVIAFTTYVPLVGTAKIVRALTPNRDFYKRIPLSFYVDKSLYVIRNDALDRFGTPLEKRFSKREVTGMMEGAGLTNVNVSANEPFWHAVGQKAATA